MCGLDFFISVRFRQFFEKNSGLVWNEFDSVRFKNVVRFGHYSYLLLV